MSVKQIQLLLLYLGYDPGEPDGILGPGTAAAVAEFQRGAELEADGVPGLRTQQALRRAVAKEPEDFWAEIPNFTPGEFACKCGLSHAPYCDGYPARMQEEAVRLAQRCRDHFGSPGYIVSGLRCQRHNADSGGVANSRHMTGRAVDLRLQGVSAGELLAFLQAQPQVRYAYAINGTNVHYDV